MQKHVVLTPCVGHLLDRHITRTVSSTAGVLVAAALVMLPAHFWSSQPETTGATSPTSTNVTATSSATTMSPSAAASEESVSVEDGSESILGADAPDPFVLMTTSGPVLFTTNTADGNVPVLVGAGGVAGQEAQFEDALPTLPDWAEAGSTWAPAVISLDGSYVLAFTATDAASGKQCIGVATSRSAAGPYTPRDERLVCGLEAGGAIDPSFVVDADGAVQLIYKTDGNCCELVTSIRIVALDETATKVVGDSMKLLVADRGWEGGVIEAPSMVAVGDRWLLVYSANDWNDAAYAVGAAWCDTITGPCVKVDGPILASSDGLEGPGGLEIVADNARAGDLLVAFHAWPEGEVGYEEGSARQLHLGRIEIHGDRVTVVALDRSRDRG